MESLRDAKGKGSHPKMDALFRELQRAPMGEWNESGLGTRRLVTRIGLVEVSARERPWRAIGSDKPDRFSRQVEYGVALANIDERLRMGRVEVNIRQVKTIEARVDLREALTAKGMQDGEIVALIDSFHPLPEDLRGRPLERFGHKGVGTALMEMILGDIRSEGIPVAHCFTVEENMRAVIAKFGFERMESSSVKDGNYFLRLHRLT